MGAEAKIDRTTHRTRNEKIKKRRSGNRIRGKIDFFRQNARFHKNADYLRDQASRNMLIADELLHAHRHSFKQEIARRYAYATKKAGVFEPISDASKQIIVRSLRLLRRHPFVYSNVDCIIMYYNKTKNQNTARRGRKSPLKNVLQHAAMDCFKAEDYYILPFLHISSDKVLCAKYKEMHGALVFLRYLFRAYYCNLMPAELTVAIFKNASKYDAKMTMLYSFNSETGSYVRNRDKRYHAVCQECAVYLICEMMHWKSVLGKY